MPIKFRCVHCGQYLGISRSKAGTVVDCPTCGRSVGVPQKDGQAERVDSPSLNHNDSELAEALREVAAIAQSSDVAVPQKPPESRHDSDARETREVYAPPPQVVPADPLSPAKPIEPDPQPSPELAEPEDFPDRDATDDADATLAENAPLSKLAALADEESDQTAADSQKEQVGSGQLGRTNEIPWKMGLALILVGFVATLAGFALGRWDRKSQTENERPAAKELSPDSSAQSDADTKEEHADLLAQFGDVAFTGTVKFAKGERSPVQPDAGAWVYAFPSDRAGEEKIPADWLKEQDPAEYATGHALVVAALRALGGNAVKAGEDGGFELRLPEKGEYRILVCSARIRRSPDQPVPEAVTKWLEDYVDDPSAFLDGRQFFYQPAANYQQTETPLAIDTLTP